MPGTPVRVAKPHAVVLDPADGKPLDHHQIYEVDLRGPHGRYWLRRLRDGDVMRVAASTDQGSID